MMIREIESRHFRPFVVISMLWFGARIACSQTRPLGEEMLGDVDFPVSRQPASQAKFNRAILLLDHMTYPQARRAFLRIAKRYTTCAMAYWGVALTLFRPLWPTRPSTADLNLGWDAVRHAAKLHPQSRREQLFIAAADSFFRDPVGRDY